MELLPPVKYREVGKSYNYNGNIRIWDGKRLKCIHNKTISQCIKCGGSSICDHGRIKTHCIECGGKSVCIHKKQRSHCIDCDGASVCVHKRRKSRCVQCKVLKFVYIIELSSTAKNVEAHKYVSIKD